MRSLCTRSLCTIVLTALTLCMSAATAASQASYYTRQNGTRYQQAAANAARATTNVQTLQAALASQRTWFNQGMQSRDYRIRSRAKSRFLTYLGQLQRAYLAAENQTGNAIGWGSRYARSLLQVRRNAARGRTVSFQLTNLRSAKTNLRNTRLALERERRAAMRRR